MRTLERAYTVADHLPPQRRRGAELHRSRRRLAGGNHEAASRRRSRCTAAASGEKAEKALQEVDQKLARQLADYEKQLDKAKAKNDQASIRRITSKIKKAQEYAETERAKEVRRAEESRQEQRESKEKGKVASVDLEKVQLVAADEDRLIDEAYLRTLSRSPSAAELTMARKYLADSQHTAGGLRDLVWALLNTKEFVVNH